MTMNTGTYDEPMDFLRTVSAEALLQEMRSNVGLSIVDVRDRARIRDTGAIAGSRTYPLNLLGARVAARELEAAGFGEVFVLEGGMHRWLELGYPVEARPDSSPPSVRR
jgi:hypothetical protein